MAADINGKYEDYNVVVTMFSSDDNYAQNLISGDGVTVKYKREDLPQVNPQLYKWLAIINDKSSTDNTISYDNDIVNSAAKKETSSLTSSVKPDMADTAGATQNAVQSTQADDTLNDTAAGGRTVREEYARRFDEVADEDKMPGLLNDDYAQALSAEERTALDIIGRKLGVTIKIVDSIGVNPETGERLPDDVVTNGLYYKGVIYITNDSVDKPMVVLSHEITHHLAKNAPKEFNEYSRHILNTRAAELGTDINSLVSKMADDYRNAGVILDNNAAIEEIAADYTRTFLNDTDSAMRLINSIEDANIRQNVWQRFIDAIKAVLSKLRSSFKKVPKEVKNADAAVRYFERMLKTASEKAESVNPNEKAVFAEDGVSFSMNKSFEEQVHDVLNGKEYGNNHVYVGETTSILKQLGLNDKPMLITAGHLKDINHEKVPGISKYHGLPEETINKLPHILNHPAIVFDSFSKNNPDAVCILSEISDKDKLPVLVAIKPDGQGRYNDVRIDTNFILSMYGRNNPQGFLNDIANHKDKILYADKKRTQELLRGNRLQLPKSFSNLKFNTIIHESNNIVKSKFSLKHTDGAGEKNNNIYDYAKSFEEQIDDWKKGLIPKRDSLLVGGTPEVFKNIGFNPLPFTINQTHIDYAVNGTKDIDHLLGENMLKQLPDKIKNPIAVIESKTHPDTSVVVLLDFQHNGKTVVAPVEIDGYGHINNVRIDSNAVTSVFGKNNAVTKQLVNAINDYKNGGTGVYCINTKKAAALLQSAGHQLPGGLFLNSGYIDSIAYTGLKVNAKLKNNTYYHITLLIAI